MYLKYYYIINTININSLHMTLINESQYFVHYFYICNISQERITLAY